MTRLSRVVWNEGMHLAQHHFQTQSRYYEESIRFAVNQLYFEPVGLAAAGFDQDGLLNGVVSLTHARGIMPDGTPFQIPETDAPPDPLDLNPIFQPTEHQQTVFLTLPFLRPGAANCSTDGSEGLRYIAETRNLLDETTGVDERPVTLGRKNFELALASSDENDRVLLPVARVKRDGSGQFVYDSTFIPPCIQIGASEKLMGMLADLLGLLERKAESLAKERDTAGEMVAQYGGQDLASFWLSHAIHSGIAPSGTISKPADLTRRPCTWSWHALPGPCARFPSGPVRMPYPSTIIRGWRSASPSSTDIYVVTWKSPCRPRVRGSFSVAERFDRSSPVRYGKRCARMRLNGSSGFGLRTRSPE